MRLLLDTCTFIWAIREPEKISPAAFAALADPQNERFLSVVTAWEVAQKVRLGKISFTSALVRVFARAERDLKLQSISLELAEALTVSELPLLHRDPFDRMLVCQAASRGLTLVTPDELVRQYDVPTLW